MLLGKKGIVSYGKIFVLVSRSARPPRPLPHTTPNLGLSSVGIFSSKKSAIVFTFSNEYSLIFVKEKRTLSKTSPKKILNKKSLRVGDGVEVVMML